MTRWCGALHGFRQGFRYAAVQGVSPTSLIQGRAVCNMMPTDSEKLVYRAKTDPWLKALLWVSAGMMVGVAVLVAEMPAGQRPFLSYVVAGVIILIGAWIFFMPHMLRYELDPRALRVWLFPMRVTVPYTNITGTERCSSLCFHMGANFALSMDHIVVYYKGGLGLGQILPLIISPDPPDEFYRLLQHRILQCSSECSST